MDRAKAILWGEEAAKAGVYSGAVTLHRAYQADGNPELSIRWLRRAAELGDLQSQFEYGQM